MPPRERLAAQGPPEHSDPSPGVSLERLPSGFNPWSPNAHSPETRLPSSPCPHRRRLAQNVPRGSLEHSNTSCRLLQRVTEPLWVLHSKKKCVFLDLVVSGCRSSPSSSSPALQQPIPVPRRRTGGWAQPQWLLVPPPCPGSDASTAPNSQLPELWLLLTLFSPETPVKASLPHGVPHGVPHVGLQQPWVRPGKRTREAELSLDFLLAWRLPRNLILLMFTADKLPDIIL